MGNFDPSFLIRALRIAEEHLGSSNPLLVEFNGERIGKLASTVCQDMVKEHTKKAIMEQIEIDEDFADCGFQFDWQSK